VLLVGQVSIGIRQHDDAVVEHRGITAAIFMPGAADASTTFLAAPRLLLALKCPDIRCTLALNIGLEACSDALRCGRRAFPTCHSEITIGTPEQ